MSKRRNIEDDARNITGALPKRPTAAQLAPMYRQRIPTPPKRDILDERSYSAGAPRRPVTTFGDERRYSVAAPTVKPPAEYISEAYANALLGPTTQQSYDPFTALAGMLGGGGGGGGRGRGGGGGMNTAANRAAINEAIKAMTEAATASQGRIGELYSGAGTQLADMAAQYAAAQQALGQGAGRTLGAFGVTGEQMNPMGMSAGDYLTSQQGVLTGLSAAQQAQLEAQKAAYQLILADMLKAGG